MIDFWDGRTILVTGGTGFMGSLLIKKLLDETCAERIVSVSRRWDNSERMVASYRDSRLTCLNGDVRDIGFLNRVFTQFAPNAVIHTAAYKSVPSSEENVIEAKTVNVDGTINVLEAANNCESTKHFCFISTDKACAAVNAYGRTKALAESIVSSNWNHNLTAFSVRYGNVVGSTGAVFDKFLVSPIYQVTDLSMTRFWFRPTSAADFVLDSFKRAQGGEVFVPELKSSTMGDLVEAFCRWNDRDVRVIGTRLGEKKHEAMISREEGGNAYYIPEVYGDRGVYAIIGEATSSFSEFTSENADRYSPEELDKMLREYIEFAPPY